MSQHQATYQQHIEELQSRTREALQREGLDGCVLTRDMIPSAEAVSTHPVTGTLQLAPR